MGQIVSSAAKPKRCNLQSISSFGTPSAGEYILVSSDNSMNAAGQGDFDCYIVGDGTTAATELPLHKFKAEELDEQLNGFEKEDRSEIAYNRADAVKWALNSSNNYTYSTSYRTIFIPVVAGEGYVVVQGTDEPTSTILGVLKTMPDLSTTSSKPADFATGYTERVSIPVGTEYEFVAPEDATYISLNLHATAGDLNPSFWHDISESKTGFVEDTNARIEDLQSQIDDINESLQPEKEVEIDLSKYDSDNNIISPSSDTWNSAAKSESVLVPIKAGVEYTISTIIATRIAWLTTNDKTRGETPDYPEGHEGTIKLDAGSEVSYVAPSDAKYLYILKTDSSGTDTGVSVTYLSQKEDSDSIKLDDSITMNIAEAFGNKLRPLSYDLDSNGNQLPTSLQEKNVQRKARQMADINWTALGDISLNSPVSFAQGTEVTGLPYSSVKEIDKYIGSDVTIHTFMTAVNNPYSLLYTENINANYSQSAWGRTYHGVNYCGPYFGTVCSSLTSMCVGMIAQWPTALNSWLRAKCRMIKTFDQSAQGLMIGDIMWKKGHDRLISGLVRNSEGRVTHVLVTESSGSRAKTTKYTSTYFENLLKNENGIMYRDLSLYRNIDYLPSDFVAGDDSEIITEYVYNDDICTFAGDKATFRENDLIVLNYNLKGTAQWTAIEVYKDDVLVSTYQLSSIDSSALPSGQVGHALVLGNAHDAGSYKARMTDGTNFSDYTYWEVIDTGVTLTNNEGDYAIAMQSSNGVPITLTLCNLAGTVYAFRELTEDEILAMTANVNFAKLNQEQYNGSIEGMKLYLKIHFVGQYGRVTNLPIEINF